MTRYDGTTAVTRYDGTTAVTRYDGTTAVTRYDEAVTRARKLFRGSAGVGCRGLVVSV